jgi:hypothetical protein
VISIFLIVTGGSFLHLLPFNQPILKLLFSAPGRFAFVVPAVTMRFLKS